MKSHWRYLKHVLRHKWFVLWECLRLGVPIWIALAHDCDKFIPAQWSAYVAAFGSGSRRNLYADTAALARATMLHYRRSKHHWQAWAFCWDQGDHVSVPMPDVYRREMLADWRAAERAHGGQDVRAWYQRNSDKMTLHPETRLWLERQL